MISHRFLPQDVGAWILGVERRRGLLLGAGHLDTAAQDWFIVDAGILGVGRRRLRLSVGYWGPHIGFYGAVDYGFGYDGIGYEGGYWKDGKFFYNSSVNNISRQAITVQFPNAPCAARLPHCAPRPTVGISRCVTVLRTVRWRDWRAGVAAPEQVPMRVRAVPN